MAIFIELVIQVKLQVPPQTQHYHPSGLIFIGAKEVDIIQELFG